jgi:hypothetical protein
VWWLAGTGERPSYDELAVVVVGLTARLDELSVRVRALLRYEKSGRAEAGHGDNRQMTRASSVNAAAIRTAEEVLTASRSARRRFFRKAWPAITTCAVRSVCDPRIGLSRCLS